MSRRAWQAALTATAAWALAWAVNRSLVEVRGDSMRPTLAPGDRLLTVPRLWLPRPGRVVVVENPARAGHLVVKRLARREAAGAVVLGDHPAASTDSRTWGPVSAAAVRRVAICRWPRPATWGLRAPASGQPSGANAVGVPASDDAAGRRATTSSSGSSRATSPSARRP